jgi:hypothetical protein
MATLGLALNLLLWSVPAALGAAALPHALFPNDTPDLASTLSGAPGTPGATPSLLEALVQLVGAESDALQVAGLGLQQPAAPDLAPRANDAGTRVLDSARTYVLAAQALVDQITPH